MNNENVALLFEHLIHASLLYVGFQVKTNISGFDEQTNRK